MEQSNEVGLLYYTGQSQKSFTELTGNFRIYQQKQRIHQSAGELTAFHPVQAAFDCLTRASGEVAHPSLLALVKQDAVWVREPIANVTCKDSL